MRKRRFKVERDPRRVILVICEGETEKSYVEILRQHYRLPITIKTRISGNSINKRLVSQYLGELGLDSKENCEICYIYDDDVPEVTEKLRGLEGSCFLSNPCIELWFLLHSRLHAAPISSDEVVKSLVSTSGVWRNYEKGKLTSLQRDVLLAEKLSASLRAERLASGKNPSTELHHFIAILENAKKGVK